MDANGTDDGGGAFPGQAKVDRSIPLGPMQRMAADHLKRSLDVNAPVTIMGEADADGLMAGAGALGQGGSLTATLIAQTAACLHRHPKLNAVRRDRELDLYGEINIGVALALPDGNLVVPVIKQADRLTVAEIAQALIELRHRGAVGKLGLDEVRGATFTISNAGMVPGVRWTTPIIPLGQTAILGVGAVRRAPVVRGDVVVPGWLLPLSLTFDHCAINGYPASQFLDDLARTIAEPGGATVNSNPAAGGANDA